MSLKVKTAFIKQKLNLVFEGADELASTYQKFIPRFADDLD